MPGQRGRPSQGGQHAFAQVPRAQIQRSVFDRSCGLKTTFNPGLLVPIFADEALPGDTMEMRMACFARLPTLLHPVMENMYLDFFFFAVPNRLLWDNWERMNGEQDNPGDSTDFLVPVVVAPAVVGFTELGFFDYLGAPTKVPGVEVSALWSRAYHLIWNEWFRDQNLQDQVVVDLGDGPDVHADYTALLRRGKRHDYFTSCLPFPQKGIAVELPLGLSAPIVGAGTPTFEKVSNPGTTASFGANVTTATLVPDPTGAAGPVRWVDPALTADLSSATAATINQIREAFQIQRLFERDARGGTRYTELIRSHFGVTSPDHRLQRPEFLGGGQVRMNVNPVAATAISTTSNINVGKLGAFGTGSGQGVGFMKSFTEHCVILGLACLRADLNYQQGLERMFSRRTRFDFFWPALAHLGEQGVLNKELYAQGTAGGAADGEIFGYQERYAEYRYKPSRITSRMRSNAAQSLDTWHLAQDFEELPLLNDVFIQEDAPFGRIVAVSEAVEPILLFDAFFSFRCTRPIPTYGVPGLIDHF